MTASALPTDEAPAEPPAGAPAKLPKYYQVKRQLLEFTATLDPGSPVPPENFVFADIKSSNLSRSATSRPSG